jgi:hypothetical protein
VEEGIELLLTSLGYPCRPCDLYVWRDAGGSPGDVLTMTTGADPCPVATWPNVSTHDFAITGTGEINGIVWFGYWADWNDQPCGYLVAADTNGIGGCPYTYIGPDLLYPYGWNNVSVVWGPTQSIGIGAWVGPACGPTPIEPTTWGAIKGLYR